MSEHDSLDLRDLQWLWDGISTADDPRRYKARQMRGDELPEWMSGLADAWAKEGDPTLNKATGMKHSVESMVEDLKERVRLDALEKTAAAKKPPLSVRAKPDVEKTSDQLLADMQDYATRHHVRPSGGQSSLPALFEAVKEKFGVEGVEAAGGSERIMEMLEKTRDAHEMPNLAQDLPTYDGSPIPLTNGPETAKERGDFLGSSTSKV